MVAPEPYGKVKLKGILFGDDNWGTVLDEEAPYRNKRGIEMKRYLVVPGSHLLKQYPHLQKPGALEYKGIATWVEYPTFWIRDKNPSRTNAIVRVACGFDGRKTWETEKDKHYTDEIKMLQEEKENLEISNIHLSEENKMLLSERKIYLKNAIEMANLNPSSGRSYEHEREGDEGGEK